MGKKRLFLRNKKTGKFAFWRRGCVLLLAVSLTVQGMTLPAVYASEWEDGYTDEDLKNMTPSRLEGVLRERAIIEELRRSEEEAARKAQEEAARKAQEEAARKAQEEAARKAQEEAARKAQEEAARKAQEEAARKAKEEAEKKAQEEAEKKAQESWEKQVLETRAREKEEQERLAKEQAEKDRLKKEQAEKERLSKEQEKKTESEERPVEEERHGQRDDAESHHEEADSSVEERDEAPDEEKEEDVLVAEAEEVYQQEVFLTEVLLPATESGLTEKRPQENDTEERTEQGNEENISEEISAGDLDIRTWDCGKDEIAFLPFEDAENLQPIDALPIVRNEHGIRGVIRIARKLIDDKEYAFYSMYGDVRFDYLKQESDEDYAVYRFHSQGEGVHKFAIFVGGAFYYSPKIVIAGDPREAESPVVSVEAVWTKRQDAGDVEKEPAKVEDVDEPVEVEESEEADEPEKDDEEAKVGEADLTDALPGAAPTEEEADEMGEETDGTEEIDEDADDPEEQDEPAIHAPAPQIFYGGAHVDEHSIAVRVEGTQMPLTEVDVKAQELAEGLYEAVPEKELSLPEAPDTYVVRVAVTDNAGYTQEGAMVYIMDEAGDCFVLDEKTSSLVANGYTNHAGDIVITQESTSPVRTHSLTVACNGTVRELAQDVDYSVDAVTSDGVTRTTYRVNGEAFAQDGLYSVQLLSEDADANVTSNRGEGVAIDFVVDTVPPTILTQGIESGQTYYADKYRFTVTLSDDSMTGALFYYVDGEMAASFNADAIHAMDNTVELTLTADSVPHDIRLVASDMADNRTELVFREVTVQPSPDAEVLGAVRPAPKSGRWVIPVLIFLTILACAGAIVWQLKALRHPERHTTRRRKKR